MEQSFLGFIPRNQFSVFKGGEIQQLEGLDLRTGATSTQPTTSCDPSGFYPNSVTNGLRVYSMTSINVEDNAIVNNIVEVL